MEASKLVAAAYRDAVGLEFRLPLPLVPRVGRDQQEPAYAALRLAHDRAVVHERFASLPHDQSWAEADIALDLLAGDLDSASHSLGHAFDLWPEDASISLLRAIAYAEQASVLGREDLFGPAYRRFSQLIRDSPRLRATALFDRAILDEKMSLFQRAVEDWDSYLTIDSETAWKSEALRRRSAVIARLKSWNEDAMGLKQYLENFRSIDREEYPMELVLELAVQELLPKSSKSKDATDTLRELASRLIRDHGDPWLRDLLSGAHGKNWNEGASALARAASLNLSGEREAAGRQSRQAFESFRRARNKAGVLAAEVEKLYALNRSLAVKPCLQSASGLEPLIKKRRYLLLDVRFLIELSGCQSRDNLLSRTQTSLKEALSIARDANYSALELRALSILINEHNVNGNSTEARKECSDALDRFWKGHFGAVRGQTLYFNCAETAEDLGNADLALAMEEEASRFADQLPNSLQAAEGLSQEALFAARLGEKGLADQALERGRKLLERAPDDEVRRRYEWMLDEASAEAELNRGDARGALLTLEQIGPVLLRGDLHYKLIGYYRLKAEASVQLGNRNDQYRFLGLAADQAELALADLPREEDRIRWRTQSGLVFRPLIELTLQQSDGAERALQLWEWYLDRTANAHSEWRRPAAVPRACLESATLLSFIWLPHRVGYWMVDARAARFAWAPGSPSTLSTLCRRFARQCSDQEVPEAEIRQTAARLYAQLFGANQQLSGGLASGRKLIIETDGELGEIPFEALVEPSGQFLAASHPIVYSPGLLRWNRLRAQPGVSPDVKTLIVAAPAVRGTLARQFPPLPDALREGEMIADVFPNSTILKGRDGTLPELAARLGTAELFHFAGHGLSNSQDGALLLAPAGPDKDGSFLTTAELSRLSLKRCRLAVLSACSSAVGESNGPVNPNSLVNGLERAGVRDIVASRWPIDSTSTFLLMREFYRTLTSTNDAATALERAVGAIRTNSGTSHPYYWASFSAFGE